MATTRWKGGARAVAQVNTFAFAGTWEADDLIRVTIGSKTYDFTAGSTTTATVVSTLVTNWAALDSGDYPEFAEITPSANSTTLTLTAATAGVPFTATLTPLESDGSAAGAQTIEGAGTATTGTAATASAGPNDWSTAKNWDTGAVPVDLDDVILDLGEYSIYYGLSQSSIDLTSLKILVRDNSAWTLGLPEINRDGTAYPEYRTQYLTLGTATALDVRTTSGRVKLSVGSNACTANVYETGRGLDEGLEALLWKGTHASNVLNVSGDSEVGVAVLGGEAATIATVRVEDAAALRLGSGCTLTTVNVYGGTLETNSAITTLTQRAGEVVHRSGAITTATLTNGGTLDYRSSGTITTLTVGSGSTVTFDNDPQARTVSAADMWAEASISAENGTVTWSAGIDLNQCTISDVSLLLPRNIRLTIGTPA